MSLHEFASVWFGLSAIGGAMLGTAGTAIDGPGAGAALAAIAVALPLYYAGGAYAADESLPRTDAEADGDPDSLAER